MTNPKITGQISSLNYYLLNGSNENVTLIGANYKPLSNLNLSLSIGNDWCYQNGKNEHKPVIEAKAKYNIGNNLNTQFRFREIGGDEQYRVTFGGSYKINKNQSIYAAIHGTAKDSGEWKFNSGGWIGYTYNFKNGVSISGEIQQNISINKATQSIGQTLSSFDDSNKTLNVILSIPVK